jgi:hypothetical protein
MDENIGFNHDNIIVDEDIDHSTEDDTHAVPSYTPVMSTNHGIIKDLERLFCDADIKGKHK